MSISKVKVVDDENREVDFAKAIPSPFRDAARRGMRFHITTDGTKLPTFHVNACRRGRSWWIEIEEIAGSGMSVRWATMESVARQVISRSQGIDQSDFDLVIHLPAIE